VNIRSYSKYDLGFLGITLKCIAVIGLFFGADAYADWHAGKIVALGHGYDGQTITFQVSGWQRSNCACYSPWPNQMCLDPSRASFKEDYAWVTACESDGPVSASQY
jgi:hypothetical protein